jgi:hypothetical protein
MQSFSLYTSVADPGCFRIRFLNMLNGVYKCERISEDLKNRLIYEKGSVVNVVHCEIRRYAGKKPSRGWVSCVTCQSLWSLKMFPDPNFLSRIPDLGSKGHQIPDSDPQQCFLQIKMAINSAIDYWMCEHLKALLVMNGNRRSFPAKTWQRLWNKKFRSLVNPEQAGKNGRYPERGN